MGGTGPVLIGFDGSPAAENALREAAAVFAPRAALVAVVWEAGVAFDAGVAAMGLVLDPAQTDLHVAFQLEDERQRTAERLAEDGARLAKECGLDAEPLALADAGEPVAEALVALARERDCQAIVVGAHGHGALNEVLLGRTAHDVVWHAVCPVLVVRHHAS